MPPDTEDDAAPMMARSHALLGAAGWLAAAPIVASATQHPLDPVTFAASTGVCAGAALLPDMDHEDGLIAGALGPLTRLAAKGVARLCGGHRHATHSLLGRLRRRPRRRAGLAGQPDPG